VSAVRCIPRAKRLRVRGLLASVLGFRLRDPFVLAAVQALPLAGPASAMFPVG